MRNALGWGRRMFGFAVIDGNTGVFQQVVASDGEMFDILSDDGTTVVGREQRLVVHQKGLLHSSVHVLVYDGEGNLLIQQRAASKRICPLLWDLSCAEHLQPGETQLQAAVRGLKEELNLVVDAPQLQLLRPVQLFRRQYTYTSATGEERRYFDNEFISMYCVQLPKIPLSLKADETEVAAVRWTDRNSLLQQMEVDPDLFTPWFRDERPFV
jgi:isopentenyl-diphosphate Delta-isomerase